MKYMNSALWIFVLAWLLFATGCQSGNFKAGKYTSQSLEVKSTPATQPDYAIVKDKQNGNVRIFNLTTGKEVAHVE